MINWQPDPTNAFTNTPHARLAEVCGLIPMLLPGDAPAKDEIAKNYAHGGGYHPFNGFKMDADGTLRYPGDPVMSPVAEGKNKHGEVIRIYESGIVSITQPDGTFVTARMD